MDQLDPPPHDTAQRHVTQIFDEMQQRFSSRPAEEQTINNEQEGATSAASTTPVTPMAPPVPATRRMFQKGPNEMARHSIIGSPSVDNAASCTPLQDSGPAPRHIRLNEMARHSDSGPPKPMRSFSVTSALAGATPTYDVITFRQMNSIAETSGTKEAILKLMAEVKFLAPTVTASWYTLVGKAAGDSVIILCQAIVLHQYCSIIWKSSASGNYYEGASFWGTVDTESLDRETKDLLLALSEMSVDCETVLKKTEKLYKAEHQFPKTDSKFQQLLDANEKKNGKILTANVKQMVAFTKKSLKKYKDSVFENGKAFFKSVDTKPLSRNYTILLLLLGDPLSDCEIHNLLKNVYVGQYCL